jgi:flagellar motor switch protein FliM
MGEEVLNQEEIDALLKGVDNGAVPTSGDAGLEASGQVRTYDLAQQTRLVRGRMPTLEMLNDRFTRLFRLNMFNVLRRTPNVSATPVSIVKFNEYTQTLQRPSSLNLVKFAPLRGTGLVVLDSTLVFSIVDSFFGGSGRHTKIEGREFTATEARVIQMVIKQAFDALTEAWSIIVKISTEFLSSEVNPQFANIVSPSDLVVVSCFTIDLDGHGGDLHVTMPYSMLEPLREVLDSGIQADRMDRDERFSRTLREEIEDAEVELVSILGRAQLTVGKLADLKPGDIIPCDFDGNLTLTAEGVPVVRGNYGASRGQQAVKVTQRISRHKSAVLSNVDIGQRVML